MGIKRWHLGRAVGPPTTYSSKQATASRHPLRRTVSGCHVSNRACCCRHQTKYAVNPTALKLQTPSHKENCEASTTLHNTIYLRVFEHNILPATSGNLSQHLLSNNKKNKNTFTGQLELKTQDDLIGSLRGTRRVGREPVPLDMAIRRIAPTVRKLT